ncbi:MAG: RagB/SusD family nutrient uptake outer membrane protein [Bacteroidales bacterium]|nr:RagB/SusD family nutrient uptake outer membrane protein [Bacteroidales bacterium]
MKKIIYMLMLLVLSANFLYGQLSEDLVYKNLERAYTEIGSNSFFSVYQVSLGDTRADNAESGGEYCDEVPSLSDIQYYEIGTSNGGWLSYWLRGYSIISNCNSIIESAQMSNFSEATKLSYIAEAKFLRSLVIFSLANTFGAIPYPVHNFEWPLDGGYTFLNTNKVPGKVKSLYAIYQQIELDLVEAINILPTRSQLNDPQSFRATSGAAESLLGKVLLYGSCFARNYPTDPRFAGFSSSRVQDAIMHLERVINSGEYSLLTGNFETWWSESPIYPDSTPAYRALFTSSQNGCKESVFAAKNIEIWRGWSNYRGLGHTQWSTARYAKNEGQKYQTNGWGFNIPSMQLIDAFKQETGTVAADDPRFAVTVALEGDSILTYRGWLPIFFDQTIFSATRKWECSQEEFWNIRFDWTDSPLDFPLIRFSDVLLLAAEANLLAGNANKALEYTNLVRRRARESGVTNKPEDLTAITYNDIMIERRVELAMEGHRFFDLLRWGVLSETLDGKFITSCNKTASFVSGKHEFLIYPDSLLSKTVDLDVLSVKDDVCLFPNPGCGNISVVADMPITSLFMYTVQGRLVYANERINNTSFTIDLSAYSPGVYFIKIQSTNGFVVKRFTLN